tara:strand:- start:127718 stop:128938 length:1221 start_codon:yes stop_codon:yes gene_type:complete
MKHLIGLLVLLGSFSVFADASKTINFEGQNSDAFELISQISETRYRDEQRDSTCTRKVPYTVNECGYETRYRQECRFEPGRNICRTEYDRVCRTVTRYRQQCSTGPGRQVCRQGPSRKECRINRNGDRVCRSVPGRRICRTEPGRRVCRQVPYQDRVCDRRPRQVCTWQPGRNVCRQVPYQEYVCRDVVRYRDEQYACKVTVKVPYNVNIPVNADVQVNYSDLTSNGAKATLTYSIDSEGELNMSFQDLTRSPLLVFLDKVVNPTRGNDTINIDGNYNFIFRNKNEVLSPVANGINNVLLTTRSLAFNVGHVFNKDLTTVKVKIVRDGPFSGPKTMFDKTLTMDELIVETNASTDRLTIDLAKYGVKLKDKKHEVSIDVNVRLDRGLQNHRNIKTRTSVDLELDAN